MVLVDGDVGVDPVPMTAKTVLIFSCLVHKYMHRGLNTKRPTLVCMLRKFFNPMDSQARTRGTVLRVERRQVEPKHCHGDWGGRGKDDRRKKDIGPVGYM
jgi:hypothetical protein